MAAKRTPDIDERSAEERALSDRLHDLSEKIEAEKTEHFPPPAEAQDGSGYGVAVRLATEFAAAVLVGAGIGWLIDHVAGTSPFGLIVFLLLGFGAGILNMARQAGRVPPAADRLKGPKGRS
ncbi:MAG: AtpZ/AtpI family protein [Hyphomicrobiales bacterium]